MGQEHSVHITLEGQYTIDVDAVRRAALQALAITGAASPAALTITIASDQRLRELNNQYAGVDSTTDVLSFPAEGEPYAVEPGEPPYLGDIVVAYPVAEKQAVEAGLPVLVEIQMLAIHGTLHLLGFDHDTPDRQAEMWAFQSAALDAVRTG